MPDIKIVTEVAGRVCALPVEVGGNVGDGEDVAFVEAMKMEIPVPPRASSNPSWSALTRWLPKGRCWRSSRPEAHSRQRAQWRISRRTKN